MNMFIIRLLKKSSMKNRSHERQSRLDQQQQGSPTNKLSIMRSIALSYWPSVLSEW